MSTNEDNETSGVDGPPYHLATLLDWVNTPEIDIAKAAGMTKGHLSKLKLGRIGTFERAYADQLIAILNGLLWDALSTENRRLNRPLRLEDIIEIRQLRDVPDPNASRSTMTEKEWKNHLRRLKRWNDQQAGLVKPRGRPKKNEANPTPLPATTKLETNPIVEFFEQFQVAHQPKSEAALLVAALVRAERSANIHYTTSGFAVTFADTDSHLEINLTIKNDHAQLTTTTRPRNEPETTLTQTLSLTELEILTLLLVKQIAIYSEK